MALFRVRPLAWREINKQLDYLEREADLETAERFLDQLMATFQSLAQSPKIGVLCGFRKPSIKLLRRWPVKDFENWLIFYRSTRDGVEVVHVIHGARDIEAMFSK